MNKKLTLWTALCLLILGMSVKAELTKVEDFEGFAVDTALNNQSSTGPLGGLWDADTETGSHESKTGKVIQSGSNKIVFQEYWYKGIRALGVNGLTDAIEEGETGALFFRFEALSGSDSNRRIQWYAGAFDLTGSDPFDTSGADYSGKVNAGFRAYTAGSGAYNIQTVDGAQTLMTGLARDQWYSAWLVIDNGADTFDLYIEEAADGAGEPGLPTAAPIGVALPFAVATTNALTGAMWHTQNDIRANMQLDEVWWAGSGGLFSTSAAQTPVPSNRDDQVDPALVSQLTWQAPLTKTDPDGDPNLVSVDQFDITIYSKLTSDVTGDDPNFLTNGVTVTDVTSPYTMTLDYDTTYFWRVDTHVTWDSTELTGTGSTSEVVMGTEWRFSTLPAYLPPVIDSFNSAITTLDLVAARPEALSATISGNSVPVTPVFTLLDTDYEFPAGANATLTPDYSNPQNPTATLATDMAGTYKVKLTVDDGTTVLEKIAEVKIYADACQAKKAAGGWSANNFDRDGNCLVDISDFAVFAQAWLNDTSMQVQENYTGDVMFLDADIFIEAEDAYAPNDLNYVTEAPLEIGAGRPRINGSKPWVSGGYYISHTDPNTFMTYEVDIPTAGNYLVMISNAFPTGGISRSAALGTVSPDGDPSNDDIFAYGEIQLSDSGATNWDDYKIDSTVVNFTAGTHLIRLTCINADFSIDYIAFKKVE